MRVLVTGASGHIASALIPELLDHGHSVVGLARSDDAAKKVEALGAEVRRGDLDDPDGLAAAASEVDGVIHLAFKHEALHDGKIDVAAGADLAAIAAIGEALAGTGKPFVGTGGTLMLAISGVTGRPGTEEDVAPGGGPRIDSENALIALADRGVRSSYVRLAPLVHSDIDLHGFTPTLIGMAREHGTAAYIGEGSNRWPAVHTRDVAVLYRLALEKAPAGSRLHGAADEGIPFKTIAEEIAAGLGVATRSVTHEEAPSYLGFLACFASWDNPTSTKRTRELLGWEPAWPGWVDDVRSGHYFA